MSYLSSFVYTIAFIGISIPIFIIILDFFAIPFNVYGVYLAWITALAMFITLLNPSVTSIFE